MLGGRFVAQSQSYGPEARGGVSIAQVVLSEVEIDYPWPFNLDLLLTLTQKGCDDNLADMKPQGVLIVDSDLVERVLWGKVVRLPFWQIARGLGEEKAINMAALGGLASFCPFISRHCLATAMAKRLPSAKVATNLLAFDEARKLAHNLRRSLKSVETKEEFEI